MTGSTQARPRWSGRSRTGGIAPGMTVAEAAAAVAALTAEITICARTLPFPEQDSQGWACVPVPAHLRHSWNGSRDPSRACPTTSSVSPVLVQAHARTLDPIPEQLGQSITRCSEAILLALICRASQARYPRMWCKASAVVRRDTDLSQVAGACIEVGAGRQLESILTIIRGPSSYELDVSNGVPEQVDADHTWDPATMHPTPRMQRAQQIPAVIIAANLAIVLAAAFDLFAGVSGWLNLFSIEWAHADGKNVAATEYTETVLRIGLAHNALWLFARIALAAAVSQGSSVGRSLAVVVEAIAVAIWVPAMFVQVEGSMSMEAWFDFQGVRTLAAACMLCSTAVIVLLLTPKARAWCASRKGP